MGYNPFSFMFLREGAEWRDIHNCVVEARNNG